MIARARAALLAVLLLLTLSLMVDSYVSDVQLIASVSEREHIPNEPPSTELGIALEYCNADLDGLSHVEHGPCRLECVDFDYDVLLDTIGLSESICESLP